MKELRPDIRYTITNKKVHSSISSTIGNTSKTIRISITSMFTLLALA